MSPEKTESSNHSQPEVEFIIFIDQCSFFNKQLGCIKALNHLAEVAGSSMRVSLGTTDQDYREKTDYRDPGHAEAGISKGDVGFKFAKFIFSNPEMVKFFSTDHGKNFISVFQQEVLQKELLGTEGHKGLLDIMDHDLVPYTRGSSNPVKSLQYLKESHPLFRFKDLTHADLHEIGNGLKKGMYASLKSIKGTDNLEALGIKSADDITINMIRNFVQEQNPSFVLQMLVDSKHVYSTVVNTNQAFREARNNAGENAVFEIEEKLSERLMAMEPEKRTKFGKKVVLIYICDDGPAWDKYIRTNGHDHKQDSSVSAGSATLPTDAENPFLLIGAKGFVELMQRIYNNLSVQNDVPEDFSRALEELNKAKKELNTQMHKSSGPNGRNGRRHTNPADFQPELLFAERIKQELQTKNR
jgi:hypothetical protein